MTSDQLPRVGLGTYSDDDRDQGTDHVRTALDAGYRHVDTAQVYENEEYVGEGIRRADVDREDVFLATKTVHVDVPGPEPEEIREAVEGCLDRLGTDYVDLLYVHWPAGCYEPETTLGTFEELREEGPFDTSASRTSSPRRWIRRSTSWMRRCSPTRWSVTPLLQQEELRAYAVEHGHWLVAYCPSAR